MQKKGLGMGPYGEIEAGRGQLIQRQPHIGDAHRVTLPPRLQLGPEHRRRVCSIKQNHQGWLASTTVATKTAKPTS